MMPRAASISSTMRRPSGNRKYSQIAWLMISAGKRWPAYGERAGVAIPLGYLAQSATASPSARNLTVPSDASSPVVGARVLLAEDDALVALYLMTTLQTAGYVAVGPVSAV